MRRTHSTRHGTPYGTPYGTAYGTTRGTAGDTARSTTLAALPLPLPLTPRAPRTPRAPLAMDIMPPQRAFGSAPVPTSLDPRRWLGLLFATLARLTARAVGRMSP